MSNERGGMLDRRLAFSDGYFHFTADFGALPPYDRVKKLMNTRQKGAGIGPVARDALGCFTRPILLSRAALHYLSKKQIYVPDGSEVTLVVDFAAFPSPANRIFGAAEAATLDWDIRGEDAARFHSLSRHHRQGLCDMLTRAGVGVDWLVPDDPAAAEAHLRRTAVDAYHLGGGLQPVVHGRPGATSVGGALRGFDNVRVLGTAAFCSTGIANPVLTLFAWGDAWVDSLVAKQPDAH